nr:MAG TPA_asm: hypothetical protein [Caudoviricetes sp.]
MGDKYEYRFVTFAQPTGSFFGEEAGRTTSLTVDFLSSVPELSGQMDGWEPISFQLMPAGDLTYLTVMLRLEHKIPDGV